MIRKEFCVECRKETEYEIKKTKYNHVIKGKEYVFDITTAICKECGEEINLHGLLDKNAYEIDKQYREIESLVSVDDIKNLMEVYNIGKAPLSIALGFGEITITRYLKGQYPSKEYSDIIKNALNSPKYMLDCLENNREKIGETAFNKSYKIAKDL